MSKTILLTGGTGLIGGHIQDILVAKGYQVHVLSRRARTSKRAGISYFQWDLSAGTISDGAFTGVSHIVHLAGASIAQRWTDSYKQKVISSRVNTAELLLKTLKLRNQKIEAFISASASGIYQPNTGKVLTEEHQELDPGFLGEVCTKWEAAADAFGEVANRVVKHRIGIVLSSQGGALAKMVPPIRMYTAPYFGNGQQYYSWIHVQDLARQFVFSVDNPLNGVYNAVTGYVTQKELNSAIANALGKKALALPAPEAALKLTMGEMSRILTDSLKLSNQKIIENGFEPNYTNIQEALNNLFQ